LRIGVISDTHIPDNAQRIPQEILDAFRRVDLIVHAGDMVDLGAIKELHSVCKKIIAVSGNMDRNEIRKAYKEKEIFKVGNYKIGLMHGYGPPANLIDVLKEAFKTEEPDIIIFGHSHNPFNETINGILFFNPGSATDKVHAAYNSYGIIEIADKICAQVIRI